MSPLALPPFDIERPVGRGGMGAVYLATDRRSGRQVALKLLRPELGQMPSLRARFRRETRAISALDHPNIVRVIEVGELEVAATKLGELELDLPEDQRPTDRGAFLTPPRPTSSAQELRHTTLVLPYIAMEWLPGRDLSAVIEERPSLEVVLDLARQILEALCAAHEQGVVHRDLKPANVRITPTGQVKLLDFGLAKLLPMSGDRETTSHLTLEGTVMGTLPYLAPEQLRGDSAGPQADLFAFGVLLFELLTGAPPYPGESMVTYARALLTGKPPKLREKVPDAPPWLGDLVDRLIAVDADDRPASAHEAHDLLCRSSLGRDSLGRSSLDQKTRPLDENRHSKLLRQRTRLQRTRLQRTRRLRTLLQRTRLQRTRRLRTLLQRTRPRRTLSWRTLSGRTLSWRTLWLVLVLVLALIAVVWLLLTSTSGELSTQPSTPAQPVRLGRHLPDEFPPCCYHPAVRSIFFHHAFGAHETDFFARQT